MKNIPKDLKEILKQNYPIDILDIVKVEKSLDGFAKKDIKLLNEVIKVDENIANNAKIALQRMMELS